MERLTRIAKNVPENDTNRIAKYTYGYNEWMYLGTKEADAIQKLAAYEDAEEQGLLIKLYAKVGDTIFLALTDRRIEEKKIAFISSGFGGEWQYHFYNYEGCVGENDFGKWVFTTIEEAEAALASMEGREDG